MYKLLFWQTAAMLAGFLIDCIAGDPAWLPHPVMAIGKLISFLDKKLRRGEAKRDLRRGVLTVFAVCLVSAAVPAALLYGAWAVSEYLYFALSAIMCWQLIAPRQLARESGRVMRRLQAGDLPAALVELRRKGWTAIASDLHGGDFYSHPDPGGKFILVVGSEAHGISDATRAAADMLVKLPMRGGAESLNAAVAAGIMMYELMREK